MPINDFVYDYSIMDRGEARKGRLKMNHKLKTLCSIINASS